MDMPFAHATGSDPDDSLPPHVATSGEPIPSLRGSPFDGPDMQKALPIEVMLGLLHQKADDPAAYLALWLRFVKSVGGWVGLTITAEGEEDLGIGSPSDAQLRHRSRWLHFLYEDLKGDQERRELLILSQLETGRYADNRNADPRATTRAIRDFLRTDGRILIDPQGQLCEGGGAPRSYTHGSEDQVIECARATRAYYAVRRRWRTERHIKRAVRMLGERTDNGWLVLREGKGEQ